MNTPPKTPCPVNKCQGFCRSGFIMCLEHWSHVPKEVKNKLSVLRKADPDGLHYKNTVAMAIRIINERD